MAWIIKCFPHILFFPTLQYIWSLPHSPHLSSENMPLESEPALSFVLFRTTRWHTWKHHLNSHLEFWQRNNFLQRCSICLCSHRSSKSGLNMHKRILKNETIWKKQVVTCHNQSSFVSLPWHVYTFRYSTSWQDFVSSHLCGNFLHISIVIMNFPLTIIESQLLFPFLLQVKSG